MAKQPPFTEVFFLRNVRVRADDFKNPPEENIADNELMRIVFRGAKHDIKTPAAIDMAIAESVLRTDDARFAIKVSEAQAAWKIEDANMKAKEERHRNTLAASNNPDVMREVASLRAEVAALKKKAA